MAAKALIPLTIVIAGLASPALAYIGPGAGISALGTLLAVVFAALLALVGFVWYPLKRLTRGSKKPVVPAAPTENSEV